MKTINISITGMSMKYTLKKIQQNNLSHSFLGADQNYNLLMEIKYEEKKEEAVKEMLKGIKALNELSYDLEKLVVDIVNYHNEQKKAA